MFLTEFAEFLESIVMTTEPLIMAGDFNIHVNVPSDNDAVRFLDLLSSMGLQQHIDFPTHVSGNILDLLITRSSDSRLIRDVQPDTTVTVRPQVPWYSDEIREAKRERRRAERRWRTTGTAADLVSFNRKKNYVTHLLKEAKSAFLAEFIDKNADHQGKLFRAVKDLLVEKNTLYFSDYADKSALANDLGRYFVQKVIRLRDELDQCAVADDTDTNSDLPTPLFIETFTPLSEEDVCRLIANSKSTSCCLDPIPTPLLKSCIEPLIPVITKIINISLDSGIFPANWKVAMVIPLLKKLGADSVFKNLLPHGDSVSQGRQ
ncbi:uncharacterized protein [Montipora capricornis]|uniref:uncharacterized protein n=1 Tax=Montipora capricornis TaxID=246305 RepID=UPI0035F1BAFC